MDSASILPATATHLHPGGKRERDGTALRQKADDRRRLLRWLKPERAAGRASGGVAIGTGLEPGDHDGNRVRFVSRSQTPMNTGRPVSVATDPGASVPNGVPKRDALSTIRELVNRLFTGDLDGETRT